MKRSRFVLQALVLAFVCACAGPQGSNVAPGPPQDKEVLITVSSVTENGLPKYTIQVSPDPVELSKQNKDKVHWKVDNQTGGELSVTLDKFQQHHGQSGRPFDGGDSFEIRNVPSHGEGKSGASGNAKDIGYYTYTLEAVLSGSAHIVIDPGVIIGN